MLEKFDPVVLIRIMRGRENNAGIGPKRASDVGHAGRRQRPDQEHVNAKRSYPGNERVLQHVAGKTRVFPEHNLRPQSRQMRSRIERGENVRRGAAEFQGGLGGDRFHIGHSTDAVRSKNFLRCRPLFFPRAPLLPVVIAEENALVFQSKQCRPFQREL